MPGGSLHHRRAFPITDDEITEALAHFIGNFGTKPQIIIFYQKQATEFGKNAKKSKDCFAIFGTEGKALQLWGTTVMDLQ